jgi:hypothetical protein
MGDTAMSLFRNAILLSGALLALVGLQTIAQAGGTRITPPGSGITVPTNYGPQSNQIYWTNHGSQLNEYGPGHVSPQQRVGDLQGQLGANRQAARDTYKAQQDEYKNVQQILNDHQGNGEKKTVTICQRC